MKGYWKREAATREVMTEDGFLITGDIAMVHPDGYLQIVDRAKDMIIVSGFNVYPTEVEDCLSSHPAILESAAIGLPDDKAGEAVKAFVVLKNGNKADEKLKLEIIGFTRKEMGPAVAPKELEFVESVPKTRSGKILRRLLKARELGLPEGDISTLENN